jgi:DNA modification methylase
VAALRYGRRFIGIDSDKNYLTKLALPRLKDELKQSSAARKPLLAKAG